MHERKFYSSHLQFWNNFVLNYLEVDKQTFIITDRERAIVKAIVNSLSSKGLSNNLISCSNHLIKDVEAYVLKLKRRKLSKLVRFGKKRRSMLKKLLERKFNVKVIKRQVRSLFNLESCKEIESKISMFNWNRELTTYFNKNIRKPISTTLKFKNKLRYPTTNASESLNHAIKRFLDFKVLSLDRLVLGLHAYVRHFMNDFLIAYNKVNGKYELKDNTIRSKKIRNLKFLRSIINDSDFKRDRQYLSKAIKYADNSSQCELAWSILKSGYVRECSFDNVYIVKNAQTEFQEKEDSSSFNIVTLNKNQTFVCSCDLGNICYHKKAVELFVFNTMSSDDNYAYKYNFVKLRKNKFNLKRSGFKGGPERDR